MAGNEVLIFSCLSEGTLRLLQDNSIDATGLQDDKYGEFNACNLFNRYHRV